MNPSSEESTMQAGSPQVRASNWSHPEIETLIDIWGQSDILEIFDSNCKNTRAYEAIKMRMDAVGYHRTVSQVQIKVKNLRQLYRKTCDLLHSSEADPSTALQVFPFYDRIDSFMSYRQQDIDVSTNQDKEPSVEEFTPETKWNLDTNAVHWIQDQPDQSTLNGSMTGGEGPKRKRVHLSIQQKMCIIERLEKGELGSKLAAEYGVGKATISDVKRQMEKICEFASSQESIEGLNRRSMRQANDPLLDKALYTWYAQERANGITPSGAMLRERALAFHRKFNPNGDTEFNASDGWLGRFKARHGIKLNGASRSKSRDSQPEGSTGWDAGQTRALLALWSDHDIQTLLSYSINNDYVYQIIAAKMTSLGYTFTAAQCRSRMMGLRRQYYRHASGHASSTFMFHDEMAAALQPHLTVMPAANDMSNHNAQPGQSSDHESPPVKRRALHTDDDDDNDDDADSAWVNDYVDDHGQEVKNDEQCEDQETSALDDGHPTTVDEGPASFSSTMPVANLVQAMDTIANTFSEKFFKYAEKKLKLKLEWEEKRKQEHRQWEAAQKEEQRRWEEAQREEQRRWEAAQKEEQRQWEAAQKEEQRQWEATQREEQRRWEAEQRADERTQRTNSMVSEGPSTDS